MIKPWLVWPLVAIGALLGSALLWDQEAGKWVAPHPLRPDIPVVDAMPPTLVFVAHSARERPVFWSSRRVKKNEPPKDTRQLEEMTQARLISVVQAGPAFVALLRRKDGSLLKITHETDPWRIESFAGRQAVFVGKDGQKLEIPLKSGRSR